MPERTSSPKRLDLNQLAKLLLNSSIGDAPKPRKPERRIKNEAAVALGKLGGRKGGKSRAANLTARRRREIARAAARARWQNETKK